MQHYIYMLRPTQPDMMSNLSDGQQSIMVDDFYNLKRMLRDGSLLLAGPCTDEAFGIVIFTAESIKEAQKIAGDDPAVKAGLMTAECHEFHVSLQSGRD